MDSARDWIRLLESKKGYAMIQQGPMSFTIGKNTYKIKEFTERDAVVDKIKRDSLRMYVFVKNDMPYVHKAVQGAHAVAAYLLKNPNTEWTNGTMVFLDDSDSAGDLMGMLMVKGAVPFYEPDWETDPVLTAVAVVAGMDAFPMHKTVKMPRGLFSRFFK